MPKFDELWINHPMNWDTPTSQPCTDSKGKVHASLENQCAIRMGLALQGAGVNTDSVTGARCWNGHKKKHILRVHDLLPWIEQHASTIGCKTKAVASGVTHADYAGKQGIVYFENFWGTNNQGDHIDLWNGRQIAKGELDYFQRSESVWFWAM